MLVKPFQHSLAAFVNNVFDILRTHLAPCIVSKPSYFCIAKYHYCFVQYLPRFFVPFLHEFLVCRPNIPLRFAHCVRPFDNGINVLFAFRMLVVILFPLLHLYTSLSCTESR